MIHSSLGSVVSTLCDPMDSSLPWLRRPWDFPSETTGVGCHFLLQGRKYDTLGESIRVSSEDTELYFPHKQRLGPLRLPQENDVY